MHLQDIQLASEGVDKNVDKSHDTTTTETTTTETNTYNTTVTPLLIDCEKTVTKSYDDSKIFYSTLHTKTTDCHGVSSTVSETSINLFAISMIVILLGAIVMLVAMKAVRGGHKKRWK